MTPATITAIGDGQELASIITAYHDVTERLKESHDMLGREVGRLRQQLEEKDRELQRRERLAALGEMAAGVAHEIRNPLAGIAVYASLMEQDLADRPVLLEHARRIRVGVRNMESIVGDILAFAGKGEPSFRATSLGLVFDSVLAQVSPQARASEVDIDIDLDTDLPDALLYCDARQIERALINLVFNAVDAVGSGGRVWLSVVCGDDSMVRIRVEDNGPGVDLENPERIFDPFFTMKDNGTGLGLAIVHRIAESHGGSVTVGRGERGGALFVLAIPTADVAEVIER